MRGIDLYVNFLLLFFFLVPGLSSALVIEAEYVFPYTIWVVAIFTMTVISVT